MRVTVREVANLAGVSVATASYALNDRTEVSSATRRRVKEAARVLNYHANHAARGLRGDRVTLSNLATNPGFVEGHTFEGNPLSCAAGLAVLREILERDLCANARQQGERLRAGFERLARKYGVIGDIRGKGLLQGIEFVRDPKTKEPFPAETAFGLRVGRRALANGLLCRFDPNWLAFGPALVVTAEQLDEMVALLDRSLGEVLNELGPRGAGNGQAQ